MRALLLIGVSALAPAALLTAAGGAAAAAVPAQVRVNQVAYPAGGAKVAYAMLPGPVASVSFTVSGARGAVLRGRSAADAGSWNQRYQAVYELPFSAVRRPGRYRITVTAGGQAATSPPFTIGASGAQYGRLVSNAVRYFTSERDGSDVEHVVLGREPANLTDTRAAVYAAPGYDSDDNLTGTLRRIGGPVNVSGGWFDAGGGYEKFAYTASYADGLLELAQRDFPGRYPALRPEAAFGLSWLRKLWNPARKVLYIQVGIGNGNARNTIQGDYNFWFLPQAEDRLNLARGGNPGPSAHYVRYRPVFEAAPPGRPASPEFALARGIYAMAKTTDAGAIVTTYPNDYYPGTEWKSDMLWGGAELALADEALHAPPAQLRADLAAQLRLGERSARGDPFGLGTQLGASDATPHAFGLYTTNALYQRYGGGSQFAGFAQQQLNFALGANGWGTTFVAGAGATFPHCMQSEIANLAGSLTGTGRIQLGAVTDGPSSRPTSPASAP